MISKLGKLILGFIRELGQITILMINIIKYLPRMIKD